MLILIFLPLNILAYRVSYDGYSLVRITPTTSAQLQHLLQLNANTSNGLDFWLRSTAVNNSADVMVAPWATAKIRELKAKNVPYTVLLEDLGKVIEDDKNAEVNVPDRYKFFSKYPSVEEMHDFLDDISQRYPLFATILEIGFSYERRPLRVLKVSLDSNTEKPAIWIQGGAHAREMIGPSTVLFIALKLAESCSKSGVDKLIQAFDWYIYPVVNPDGYEYARTTDRLWRKTRSFNEERPGCLGADANRNWDFHWSGVLGASTNPCSHNYAGKEPFSEPETRAIADFMQQELEGLLYIFMDFHSYSQRWLTPWGYTSKHPPNYLDQKRLAEVATTALQKVYGTKYSVGSSGNIMYTVTGGARDWVHGVARAPYSYVIELRDKGQRGGFLLPRDQILPTAVETWNGVKAMAEKACQI